MKMVTRYTFRPGMILPLEEAVVGNSQGAVVAQEEVGNSQGAVVAQEEVGNSQLVNARRMHDIPQNRWMPTWHPQRSPRR